MPIGLKTLLFLLKRRKLTKLNPKIAVGLHSGFNLHVAANQLRSQPVRQLEQMQYFISSKPQSEIFKDLARIRCKQYVFFNTTCGYLCNLLT